MRICRPWFASLSNQHYTPKTKVILTAKLCFGNESQVTKYKINIGQIELLL